MGWLVDAPIVPRVNYSEYHIVPVYNDRTSWLLTNNIETKTCMYVYRCSRCAFQWCKGMYSPGGLHFFTKCIRFLFFYNIDDILTTTTTVAFYRVLLQWSCNRSINQPINQLANRLIDSMKRLRTPPRGVCPLFQNQRHGWDRW